MKKAKVSKYGQWKYPGQDTIIPNANGSITMKGVPYPVLGIDDQGNQQMMMPGMDYQFPGNSVYEIPMAKKGGAKKVKIKSLPKAQSGPSSSGLTPEQQQNFEDQYYVYRDQGDFSNDARRLAFNDASYFGSGPIYNFQSFLPNPDSGVRVASGKRFAYENIDPKTFDPWEENYMSDPEYVARYNKMTPDQQRMAQDNVYGYEGLDTYNYNLDNVKKWEKNWYSKRATLPQFTDVANKRLSLVENINMQPYGNVAEYQNMRPGSGGFFMPGAANKITIPSTSFSYPSILAHERSHWYDWNAPQNDDMYNGSYLRSYTKGTIPNPVYNDEDPILNNIIPGEYKMPYGTSEPLRSGENDTNTYDSETEKIIANLPNASDNIRSNTVKIPFKGQEMMFGNTENNINYYHNPTEVRARLNEWRMNNNIDPTKDYSNEELQQIIDNDIKNNRNLNFDLYKVIQGRGDLLKQINDSYVSTGDKKNPDEMPKAQDGLPADYESFLKYSETAPENRRPDSEWQYGNPRQYDHYGMWDALGKPENFNQALEKNPQWQPDPYDNMYHGFSTNPNTGVWLKSHIPGESHPGDTGWMEYKDFMLSNDRNWGGKNQNLVYDPDLQRMRYVDREKVGGTIKKVKIKSLPKAQDGFLGNVAKQFNITPASTPTVFDQVNQLINTPKQKQLTPSVIQKAQEVINKQVPEQTGPGVFEQVDKFGKDLRNIKPASNTPSESIYNRFTKMLEAAQPEPEVPKSFTLPDDYYTRLMQEENGVNEGLKNGRYYQYPSHEKGTDTIGYGHKLTKEEQNSSKYSKGLTKDDAVALMRNDVQEHMEKAISQYNNEYGNGAFDKLHPDLKVLAVDYVYNGIPINKFPTFFGAANKYSTVKDDNARKAAYDIMLKEYLRYDDKDQPLTSRNNYTYGVLTNLKQKGGLPKAQAMGQFSDWRNILDYKNAAEPKQNLVGNVRKVERPVAVASSTKTTTQKLPINYKELKEYEDLSRAADAKIASGLNAGDFRSSYPNDPAGLPSVPVFEAALMAPVALKSMGAALGTELFGTGVTAGNVLNPAFTAHGIYNFANPNSDFRQALTAYNKGEGDWRDVAFEGGLNALNFFGAKTLPSDFKAFQKLSKSSPLLNSASRSSAGVTKPTLLTQVSEADLAAYEDDLLAYIAETEGTAGIDRDYLMALPEDQYRMYGELGNTLRNPGYTPTQGEIRQFLQMDSRLNNRIMPPADEMVFDNYGFREMYANPFADVPLSRVRSSSSTNTGGTTNRSYMTKEETKALVKDKAELDKLDKLDDTEFRDLLITPDGRIKLPEKYTGPKEMIPIETDEWVNEFNDNIDLLNRIIAKNNTSGRDYWVTGIDRNGYLKFANANGKLEPMYTRITPGRFRGEVADVASMDYMANDIPGLIMEAAQPIFGEAVRGTGTYKSLNEFLKAIDLGRIKSGMNSQSGYSKSLWENAIKKGNAFGYYSSPKVVHGIMKKEGGTKKKKPGFQVLTDADGKYVFVKT